MTLTIDPQVTAPKPATPAAGPAIPPRVRRRYAWAAYGRQATRRATWARHENPALPAIAVLTSIAAALTIDAAIMGLTVLAVVR